MERARGISVTSAALQFAYRDVVVNLLALFVNRWRLEAIARDHSELKLEPLLADTGA